MRVPRVATPPHCSSTSVTDTPTASPAPAIRAECDPQAGASGSGAGTPSAGMPSPTEPAAAGATERASQASPDRVRRTPTTGPSATRWCGAAYEMSTVTWSPGRTSATGRVKWTSRLSGPRPESRWVAASLRPSPSATISFKAPAHESLVLLPGDAVDLLDKSLVAVLDDVGRDLVGKLGGGSPRSLGVLEGERSGESRSPDHVERGQEVLLGLAREAHDDVGRDGRVRHCGAHSVDDPEIAGLR